MTHCARRLLGLLAVAILLGFSVRPASAQDRPFVFSLTTARDVAKPAVRVDYDLGVGERTFTAGSANGAEQRVGVQASLGRWTLVGRFGLRSAGDTYATSQQGEVLFSVLAPSASGLSLAVGGGMLHEVGGTDVLLARVTGGHETASWRAHGNVLLQKPLAAGRDAVDLITSVGWAARLTPALALGVEGIGEDLEGFWEAEEAEGGARLLVGPSMHIAPPGRRWQLSLAGGPMFHPASSTRESVALRDLPATTSKTGYAVKMSFSATF
jgi:hypothetical protein